MKILVTGAKGQLGYDCVRELKERGFTDVYPVDVEELDITDKKVVDDFINKIKPDVIMHNAAYTSVDKAEVEQEIAYKTNVLGTKYLAEAAKRTVAKFVYISTDYVFSGEGDAFYEVNDKVSPKSYYGQTKYLGELEAMKCPKHFIVRTSWVFGQNGKNFVKTMLQLSKSNKEINVVDDQIGSPTYTYDLSKLLCDMIISEKYGTYHASNEGVCSWADFAREIFKLSRKNIKIHGISSEKYRQYKPEQAVRPLNSRLSKRSLDDSNFNRLPLWNDALKRYLKEIKVL